MTKKYVIIATSEYKIEAENEEQALVKFGENRTILDLDVEEKIDITAVEEISW